MEPLRKLTREERISARAARVAAKRNKDDGSTKNVTETGEPQRIISASKQHITGARQRVDHTKLSASRVVSSVKLARDASESERRRIAEQARIERMNKLETELAEATKINQEIEANWEQVAKKNIPQDLYQEIANQYKAASKLLASKDELIKMLQNDLKIKDEDYVELLAQHQEDIMTVVKRMHEQFHLFRECCEKELQQIESVFIEERRELLEKSRAEIDSLFEKRRRMELQIMENAAARERQFASELAEIRSRDSEDYNALKVDLENSIQVLEQQLEEMRATYQLNSEKLEYNHSVLMERDQENKTTEEHHLQRLRRLKEALSAHIHRFHRQDAKYRQENAELTEEYKRITEQFKDLQKKYHHFETVDSRQYHQVWEMNEQRVMTLVRKVLKADQLITTQILGLKWAPPVAMQSGRLLDIDSITSTHVFNTPGPNDPVEHKTALNASSKLPDSPSALAAGTTTVTVTPGTTNATQPKGQFTNEQIKHVMDILSVECGFLLDSRVQDTLTTLTDDDEKQMYKVDTILSALGVEDREDVDELVAFFYDDPIHDKPSVHPNDVTRIVRDFVVKRQQSKAKPGTSGIHVKHTDSVTAEKKMRKKQRERLFWQKLGEVIPDSTYAVWTALEKAQVQYNTLLEERSHLITETTDLARQNEELKVLLQEYLGSKINEELQIPPTRLIRVDPR